MATEIQYIESIYAGLNILYNAPLDSAIKGALAVIDNEVWSLVDEVQNR